METDDILSAAREGDFSRVRFHLKIGANVHAPDSEGEDAALRQASKKGNIDVVHLLVENGANIHAVDDYALRFAAANGHIEVVRFLIDKGANVHADDDDALRLASENGHVAVVRLLLEKGADVHADDDEALRLASASGHVDVVRLLLENDAYVHADDDGALRLASVNGHVDVVRLLLENGADVHADDDDALRLASAYGHINVVRLLIENGADVHAEDDEALRLASVNGHVAVVRLLLENDADVNADYDGALRLASENGHVAVVRLLIENGAHVYERTVITASVNGHDEIVALLRTQGVLPDPYIDSDDDSDEENSNEDDSDEENSNEDDSDEENSNEDDSDEENSNEDDSDDYLSEEIEGAYYSFFYNHLDDIDIPQSNLNILLENEMNERGNLEMVEYLYNRGARVKLTPTYIKTAGEDFPTDELKWRIVMFFVAKGFLPATTDLLAAASNGDVDKVMQIITTEEFIPPEIIDAYISVRDSQNSLPKLVLFDRTFEKKVKYGELINPSIAMAYALAYAHGHEQVVRVLEPYVKKNYKDTLPIMNFYLNSLPKLPDIPVLERIVKLNPSIVDTVVTRAIQTDNADALEHFFKITSMDVLDIVKEAIDTEKMRILTYAIKNTNNGVWIHKEIINSVIKNKNVDALDVVYRFSRIRMNPEQFTDIAVKNLHDFIHYLVENGLVQEYKDEALILASNNGNYELVDYLIKRGADPDAEQRRAFRVAKDKGIYNLLGKKPSFFLVHRPTEDVDSVFMTPFAPSIAYRMCVNGHPWLYDPVNEVHFCPLCRAGAQSELFVNSESGPPVIYTPEPNPGLITEQKKDTRKTRNWSTVLGVN